MAESTKVVRRKTTTPIDNTYGHLQPQALDFERVVLGALMIDKDAFSIISEMIRPETFYEPRHQKIYTAIQTLNMNENPVDIMTVTDELKREGMARDFVRLVQTLRKDKDFNISDRIELCYATDDAELCKALDENKAYVAEQVLAVKVSSSCSGGTKADIEGAEIVFDAKVTDAKVA